MMHMKKVYMWDFSGIWVLNCGGGVMISFCKKKFMYKNLCFFFLLPIFQRKKGHAFMWNIYMFSRPGFYNFIPIEIGTYAILLASVVLAHYHTLWRTTMYSISHSATYYFLKTIP